MLRDGLALEDLCDDRMASGLCAGARGGRRARWQKLQSQSTSNPTSIVQKAAVAALNGSQECVAEMRAEYIQLRDHIVKGLRAIPGVKCTMPEGAFYAYPNVSSFFGAGRHEVRVRCGRAAAARGARGHRSRRGLRHERPHSRLLRDVEGELDRGLERMRKFFAAL